MTEQQQAAIAAEALARACEWRLGANGEVEMRFLGGARRDEIGWWQFAETVPDAVLRIVSGG